MINKKLVKQRFEKSFDTYDDNALIQKKTAKDLTDLIKGEKFSSVFEIGCATGILTKELKSKILFDKYFANDIVEKADDYISRIIDDFIFIPGDIETIELSGSFDLIISNACLQWCCDIDKTVLKLKKHLNPGGKLVFSIFGKDNLKEIKQIFGINNFNNSIENFLTQNIPFKEEKVVYEFSSLFDILKHLKYTGVNALTPFNLTKSSLKKYEEEYKRIYSRNDKLILTYNPIYFIFEKAD